MFCRTFPVGLDICCAFILFCSKQLLELGGPGRCLFLFRLEFLKLQPDGHQLFFQTGAFFHESADLFQCRFRTGCSGTQLRQFSLEFFDLFFPEVVFLDRILQSAVQFAAGCSRGRGRDRSSRPGFCSSRQFAPVQGSFRCIRGFIRPAFCCGQTAPAQIQTIFDHISVPLRILPPHFLKGFHGFLIQGQRLGIFAGDHFHFPFLIVFESLPPNIP